MKKMIKIILSLFIIFGLIGFYENSKSDAASIKITTVNKLGKIKNKEVLIHPNINDLNKSFPAGTNYINKVYYVKQQAQAGKDIYYSISLSSSNKKVIGWVKSTDITTYEYKTADKKSKILYIKGTGTAYSKPWGGSKDIVFQNLSKFKFTKFTVNSTVKVGKNTWYRGTLKGKTIWIHSKNVVSKKVIKSDTSRLGKLKTNAEILTKLGGGFKKIPSDKYLNNVFYIKQQGKFGNEIYYLISTKASKTDGLIGWVNSKQITSYAYKTVDKKSKTFYIKGTGTAYSKPWGGSKNIIFKDLSTYKFGKFKVTLTTKVAKNLWYKGTLGGKTVWIHSNNLVSKKVTKSDTSRLGQLKSNAVIYNKLSTGKKIVPTKNYLNKVFYIKQQAKFGSEIYYLISTKASKKEGLIGWVKSTHITSYSHKTVDKKEKLFYITGSGAAYSKPWGGSKDIVYSSLKQFESEDFFVDLTNSVGKNYWYRGKLNGKTVWIHQKHLVQSYIKKTKYNITFNKALELQMTVNPQTDKYRNSPAYVSSEYITSIYGQITVDNAKLRSTPKVKDDSNVVYKVKKGTKVTVLNSDVKGDKVSGSTKWFKIQYKEKELYVHSSVAKIYGTTTANVNVRASASSSGHIYGTIQKGKTVTITNIGTDWHTITYQTWRNAKKSDVSYYLNPNNFIKDKIQKFQFLDLRRSSGVSKDKLNSFLKDKGIFKGQAQAFIDAGKKYGVNELYLVAHAMLETGNGTSQLAKGVKYNGVTVYNMYGIGAYDSCPLECGAKMAYEKGWTTPKKAIIGGAQFVGSSYIYGGNKYGFVQNTLYKMLWNPEGMVKLGYPYHQYATDIGWAYKQVNTLYNLYSALNIKNVVLDIPVYK